MTMDGTVKARVEREVGEMFAAYEAALGANDLEALAGFFRDSPETVRMMTEGGLYGRDQIVAFRKGRDTADLARVLTRVQVTALTPEVAVAVAEYRRTGSGRCGAQSQVWLNEGGSWHIAAAHVSLGELPGGT